MFDPFKDFETAGYLRNKLGAKDQRFIKEFEHELFTRQLSKAIQFLSGKKVLSYKDFLLVHKILFSDFYP